VNDYRVTRDDDDAIVVVLIGDVVISDVAQRSTRS